MATKDELKEQLDAQGIEYSDDAKKADLEALLPESEDEAEKPEVKARKVEPKELLVVLPNGTKRLYREVSHGKVWKVLAKNFAEANEGAKIIEQ